ncbi:nibrin-like isoform X2 [Penaeus chinensis]|uniref:nibrin-like isoform X2 n=1 Tax=Penaeus chinensis TaxID=139456 RepID=UPI001FB71502|nr:nibrin-like isoform X2 [Penaeus chinensis]
MWVLEGTEDNPGQIHYLPCGPTLMVSRREGHILLRDDNSISRQHASITVTHSMSDLKNITALPKVNLSELGSKYGTFVNEGIEKNRKLAVKSTTELNDGDRIRFGMLTNVWRLGYKPLVVTASTLKPDHKKGLADDLLKLGGHLVSEWNPSCSYLVMNNITLTVKVVCALAGARPIVTPEFFTKWAEAVVKKEPLPDASDFLPPLQELSLDKSKVDFSPMEARKSVLQGRTLLFSSAKQISRMGPAVELAGGKAEDLTAENFVHITKDNYLVIQQPPDKNQLSQSNSLLTEARKTLKEKGLRVIPESDIGLAILYLNTEGHCNPAFKVNNILRKHGSTSQMTEGLQIYATETQNSEMSLSLTGSRVIPETGESSKKTPSSTRGGGGAAPPSFPSSFPLPPSANSTSMASPKDVDITQNNTENKENLANNQKKRPRTGSVDAMSPPAKLSNRSQVASLQPPSEPPEPTQPMEEKDDSQESEMALSRFDPKHHSTQREPPTSTVAAPNTAQKLESRAGNSAVPASSGQSVEPTAERSIPFEPYTLPSLKTEALNQEDELTQPFQPIKEEPSSCPVEEEKDVILDETDYRREKRPIDEIDLTDENETHALQSAKRTKVADSIGKRPEKRERSPPDTSEPQARKAIKQESEPDEDLFTLPGGNARIRRRADMTEQVIPSYDNLILQKAPTGSQVTAVSKIESTDGGEDPFALPTSSRAQRRRQQQQEVVLKVEERQPESSEPAEHTQTNGIPSNSLKSSASVITSSQENFLSKTNSNVKQEPGQGSSNSVADLTAEVERSLLIVEVTSLVKRQTINNTTNIQNTTVSGMPNFKRFKKSVSEITVLPRIIGGRDLMPHDQSVNSQREEWLKQQEETVRRHEDRNAINEEDEELFALPTNPWSRIRTRR